MSIILVGECGGERGSAHRVLLLLCVLLQTIQPLFERWLSRLRPGGWIVHGFSADILRKTAEFRQARSILTGA
jgi:hypothetical protein